MPTLYDNFSQVRQYIDENNTSYVTKTELANASYASTSYVADYVAEHGGGGSTVIDENIIPKETNTYTLGDSNYKYSKVYSTRFVGGLSGDIYNASNLIINLGNADKYRISSDTIRPDSTNTNATLGTSDYAWAATYTSRVKVGNNSQIYNDGGGITLSVNNNAGIRMGSSNFYPKNNNGMNLGQSSNAWNNTYTKNIYADTAYISNYNNLIWTGTAAEYEALADYTTYQFYLIQES